MRTKRERVSHDFTSIGFQGNINKGATGKAKLVWPLIAHPKQRNGKTNWGITNFEIEMVFKPPTHLMEIPKNGHPRNDFTIYIYLYHIYLSIFYMSPLWPLFGVPNSEKSRACREALPGPPPKPGLSWEHRESHRSPFAPPCAGWWLSPTPPEKWWSESQLGWNEIPNIWENKHVPKHQPDVLLIHVHPFPPLR